MLAKMKDASIVMYYESSKCCNKTPHKGLEGISTAKISNISRIFNNTEKLFFFLCIYKMVNITKEKYETNGIEVITDQIGELWLNEWHVQQQLGRKNLTSLTKKYDEKYKKCIFELNESKNNHVEDLFIMI